MSKGSSPLGTLLKGLKICCDCIRNENDFDKSFSYDKTSVCSMLTTISLGFSTCNCDSMQTEMMGKMSSRKSFFQWQMEALFFKGHKTAWLMGMRGSSVKNVPALMLICAGGSL
jgi:hypothetical protein